MPVHVFERNPKSIIMILILCPIMVLACLYAALNAPLVIRLVGWFGIVFFGGGSILSVIHLLKNPKMLVLTEEGFYDNSSIIAPGERLIPWEQVTGLRPINGGREIAVTFVDPNLVSQHLNPFQQLMSNSNKKMFSAHHIISLAHIKGARAQAVISEMEGYIRNRQQQLGIHPAPITPHEGS